MGKEEEDCCDYPRLPTCQFSDAQVKIFDMPLQKFSKHTPKPEITTSTTWKRAMTTRDNCSVFLTPHPLDHIAKSLQFPIFVMLDLTNVVPQSSA